MRNLVAIVVNNTNSTIDLCKVCLDIIPLYPGNRLNLPLTARGGIHGHSDIGSFIISKYDATFMYQAWGKFEIRTTHEDGKNIFEINLKK